jgi:hypothetical protein
MHALSRQKQQQQQQHTTLAKKILQTENFKNHEETYMYSCARAITRFSFCHCKKHKKAMEDPCINQSLTRKKNRRE